MALYDAPMQRGIAIETSGRVGSVAVVEGDRVVAEETFPHGLKHAAGLIPIMDQLIKARGWTPKDLEAIYVSAGPGSFTGLRIGITLAKTMALATGVKLVAVPSVRVLAMNAPPEASHVVVVLDAKREQIFTARFERVGGEWVEREGAHLDRLSAMVERSPRPVYLVGEGIPYHRNFLTDLEGVLIAPEETWRARAGVVAEIGMKMAAAGEFVDPFKLVPLYVRRPEAEEKLEQKERGG